MAKIVVGIDGSDSSTRALRWAVAESAMRDAEIVAVHAWTPGRPAIYEAHALADPDWKALAHATLDEAVDPVARDTGAIIQKRLVERHAAEALLRASADADLLVLGTRGHGPVGSLVLGSVGQHCIHRATCPVVVVPAEVRAA